MKKPRLHPKMTPQEFENGYWYASELKQFALVIGVRSISRLRKDELEGSILAFLHSGRAKNIKKPARVGKKDVDLGLRLSLPVQNYTSNKTTKDFIVREAKKRHPDLKERSGVRYRLNRWREDRIKRGKKITYGDIVEEYINLNTSKKPFAKIPSGRYINFLAEYLAHEKGRTRTQGIAAWNQLKKMDAPKTYAAWKKVSHKTNF